MKPRLCSCHERSARAANTSTIVKAKLATIQKFSRSRKTFSGGVPAWAGARSRARHAGSWASTVMARPPWKKPNSASTGNRSAADRKSGAARGNHGRRRSQ